MKRSLITISILLFAFSFSLLAQTQFVHPGVMHTQESLDFVRQKISAKEEPWTNP